MRTDESEKYGFGEVPNGFGEVPNGFGEVPNGFGEVPNGFGEVPDGFGEVPGGFGEVPGGFGEVPGGFGEVPGGFGRLPGGFGEVPDRFARRLASPTAICKAARSTMIGLLFLPGRRHALACHVACVALALWSGGCSRPGHPTPQPLMLDVGDGSNLQGREILAAASLLSDVRSVQLRFTAPDGTQKAISTVPRQPGPRGCDPFMIQLARNSIVVGDEILSPAELEEKLQIFSDAVKLSDSRAVLILHCEDGTTSGTELIHIMTMLTPADFGIILMDYGRIFEPGPPPPQKELLRSFHQLSEPVIVR